jgi:hypothetical protein
MSRRSLSLSPYGLLFRLQYPKSRRKIDLNDQLQVNYGSHRSGWSYAIQCLAVLHRPGGVLIDTFIERTFFWHPRGVRPHLKPWIGFIHVPPRVPAWFMPEQSNDRILGSDAFRRSLPFCRGLYVLTDYHRRSLEGKLEIPVNRLFFPTETPRLKWSWERFVSNPQKKIMQVGWWLRRLHSIFLLKTDRYRKIYLDVGYPHVRRLMAKEAGILKEKGLFRDDLYTEAERLPFVSNPEYDRLLSENLVFIHLYDASANNTVIECIVRNTPLLVNPVEGVKEYLGEEYPLYFESLEEAAAKAEDLDLIRRTHGYLVDLPIKRKLKRSYFLKSFVRSEIYSGL